MIKNFVSWTASNMFILPTLYINRQILTDLGFVNSFLFNEELEEEYESPVLHLLFKITDVEKFNMFVFEERERGCIIVNESDYSDNHVVLTYVLPFISKEDMDLFWEGKYSKMSDTLKNTIPKHISFFKDGNQKTGETIQHMIFSKSSVLKEFWEKELGLDEGLDESLEFWLKPSKEKETFNLNKISNDKG